MSVGRVWYQCAASYSLCPLSWMKPFSASLAIYVGNSPVTGELPAQRPVTRSFDVFFDLSLSKRSSKQSLGWCFETPSCPLWLHCNDPNFSSSMLSLILLVHERQPGSTYKDNIFQQQQTAGYHRIIHGHHSKEWRSPLVTPGYKAGEMIP